MKEKGINIENPKTKTDFEVRDMEWKNIRGWLIIIGVVYLASKFYKKGK